MYILKADLLQKQSGETGAVYPLCPSVLPNICAVQHITFSRIDCPAYRPTTNSSGSRLFMQFFSSMFTIFSTGS